MVILAVILIAAAFWATVSLAAGIGLGRVMARADAEESRTVLSRSSDPLLVPARL
ncbi:hypothetical protein [Microbacterium sp. CFBP 8794]|uniref:hypothetical protein n=1 Tax=Microbacterium sp. CFBP 8794 TaxID=2775269 RepID=UPI00177CF5A5|nr:hypothetical protein [Microbacterium sp. CFBP 8794]MBD8478248.1 hypothetical protein [Microbacterium sp. CFBP 8794]